MPKDKINISSDEIKRQSEKDRVQKDMAADKAKPRCSICGKYTDKKTNPQCHGHGGGGGGGGSGDDKASKDDATVSAKSSYQSGTRGDKEESDKQAAERSDNIVITSQSKSEFIIDNKFKADVISELLSKKILMIDNDREKGILTIKLQYDPTLLPTDIRIELKKYINLIISELNKFKRENGISAKCHTIEQDKEGNILSLRIGFPTPTLYDAFIHHLASKFLLPIQNVEQKAKEKVVYQDGMNHFPTPFSTKPTPFTNKHSEGESQRIEDKKTSPIRPKSLLDGLKPKGWK